jgi:hypothetical protein
MNDSCAKKNNINFEVVNAPNKICWIIHILNYLCLLSTISPIIKYGGVEKLSNGADKQL